ncbi:MAG: hypothetical protein N4A61_14310 [Pelagimonas sp.]|jgi:hypothetical protein|nr:hypothetical protein [Pelagimonas sp.]
MTAKHIALTVALGLGATMAQADESWMSDMGRLIYQSEENGAAIFSFTNVDAYPAELIIPGLAGNYDNRGVHEAYWIGQGAGTCPAFMARPGGQSTTNWGRALISFDRPAFPTGFTLTLGDCFGPMSYAIRADLP